MHHQTNFRMWRRSAFFLLIIFAAGSFPVFAQAPTNSLSESIAAMSLRAAQLLPRLEGEFIGRLITYLELIAQGLAAVILLFSFIRLWRESGGVGIDTVWWSIRLGVCLFLLGTGPYLVGQLHGVGREIAEGNEIPGGGGTSMIFEFYAAQRTSFNDSYQKFLNGQFTVDVRGETLELEGAPSGSGTGGLLGVVYDTESTVKDIDRKLDVTSYSMPTLFSAFNGIRGILEAGNFWLLILAAFLIITAKMLAPFAIATAIDSKLAQRFTYPFVWGTLVLTVFWPSVSYIIRGLAYFFGNVAMALGDGDPLYNWDPASMTAIRNPMQHPAYTIAIAGFMMLICALGLWVSPFITAWLSMGKFYEGVSQIASGYAGAIIGTGVETYSASAAAAVNKQAAQGQVEGNYQADTTRAKGEYEGSNLATRARQTSAIAGVRGNLAAQLSQIYASATTNTLITRAQQQMAIGQTQAGVNQAIQNIDIDKNREKDLRGSEVYKEKSMRTTDVGVRSRELARDAIPEPGLAGINIPMREGGEAWAAVNGVSPTQYRRDTNNAITGNVGSAQNIVTDRVAQQRTEAATQYQQKVNQTINQNADSTVGAIQKGAAISAGGVNRGAGIQIGGINKATGMELKANQTRFDSSVKGASVNRDAAIQAAKLNALASVMGHVGSKIAQEIEGGLSQHF